MDEQTWGDPEDPAIVLIDEDGGGAHLWDEAFCARVASGLRYVIRCEQAGPGTAQGRAAAVLSTMDRLGVDRAHLVGGPVAAAVAEHSPERVESLASTTGSELPGMAVPTLVLRLDDREAASQASPAGDTLATALLMHTSGGWDLHGDRLAARSIAAGDPTGWFERLYAAGAAGEVDMPWDRRDPHPLLAEWAARNGVRGDGRRAVVSGCGLGADAEFLSRLGFRTVGFDVSSTAIRVARQYNPGSAVDYRVADLLNPPLEWLRSFDLVAEVLCVQALPDPPRRSAIVNVGRLVAPGGTLLVVAYRDDGTAVQGPPWPLTDEEIGAFATDGLDVVRAEPVADPRREYAPRWRVEFRRGGDPGGRDVDTGPGNRPVRHP